MIWDEVVAPIGALLITLAAIVLVGWGLASVIGFARMERYCAVTKTVQSITPATNFWGTHFIVTHTDGSIREYYGSELRPGITYCYDYKRRAKG